MAELNDLNARAQVILHRAHDILSNRAEKSVDPAEIEDLQNWQAIVREAAERIVIALQLEADPGQSTFGEVAEELQVVQMGIADRVGRGNYFPEIAEFANISDALGSLQSDLSFLAGPNGPGDGNPIGGSSSGGGGAPI